MNNMEQPSQERPELSAIEQRIVQEIEDDKRKRTQRLEMLREGHVVKHYGLEFQYVGEHEGQEPVIELRGTQPESEGLIFRVPLSMLGENDWMLAPGRETNH